MPVVCPSPTLTGSSGQRTVELAIEVHDASQSDGPCQAVRTKAADCGQGGPLSLFWAQFSRQKDVDAVEAVVDNWCPCPAEALQTSGAPPFRCME